MALEQPIAWFLEQSFGVKLLIVGLALAGLQQSRQGHIGRVGIACAAIIVIQQAYPIWGQLSGAWRLYAMLAGIFGSIAAVSYISKTSLTTEFYQAALLLFGGGTVIMVLWFGFPV